MKRHITTKLKQAEKKLGLKIPEQIFDFISQLDKPEVKFGEEEWLFWSVTDKPKDAADNFIIKSSFDFKKEWGVNGIVFAENGIGDYLVALPDEFDDKVFVMMHESAELKLFGENIQMLSEYGPENYYWSDDYIYKLDDNNNLVKGEDKDDETLSSDLLDDDDYKLRSALDDLIDDQKTDKATDIIIGLEKLVECTEEVHKIWALNKLSDIYLKGFGPIPSSMTKALDYNQQAIDLNSHLALSNRAACYFFGLGLAKDVEKAFELATKANELSKANYFADILASKNGGGMYDRLVDMIKTEIEKQKE